jgi:4-hydroxy-tetrahydrodipicolinate reductase
MTRAVIVGAAGRMGQALVRAAATRTDLTVVAAVDSARCGQLGEDAGEVAGLRPIGVRIVADLAAALEAQPEVVIDFSHPDGLAATIDAAAAAEVALFIGTTGFGEALGSRFDAAAARIPLLVAANTSLGVTLLIELVRAAAARLPADFDIEILESHHRYKKDAPSGTALALGAAAAAGRGRALADVAQWARQGASERRPGDIGFAVVRGGDIVGEHRVLFAGDGEVLALEHRATDRAIFARGALAGAAWLSRQAPGRYEMRDVLNLGSMG